MSIHIRFTDGSANYARFDMNEETFKKEVKGWSKYYFMKPLFKKGTGFFYEATEIESYPWEEKE